jgi:hypothetical protein
MEKVRALKRVPRSFARSFARSFILPRAHKSATKFLLLHNYSKYNNTNSWVCTRARQQVQGEAQLRPPPEKKGMTDPRGKIAHSGCEATDAD